MDYEYTEWELEQLIAQLEEDLDGGKAYLYKEEVWRDNNRLKQFKEKLSNLQNKD